MRLITAADDELFHALSVAAKMGRHSLLLDRLRRRRDAEPGNPEAARPYALGLMAALPTVGDRMESHAWFSHALFASSDLSVLM